jgi:hypothetical protein
LVTPSEDANVSKLYQRLLELSDELKYVKLSLDSDGDVKIAAEGFARLDAFGQFRRRIEALTTAVEEHGQAIADLAEAELFGGDEE